MTQALDDLLTTLVCLFDQLDQDPKAKQRVAQAIGPKNLEQLESRFKKAFEIEAEFTRKTIQQANFNKGLDGPFDPTKYDLSNF